MKIGTSGCASPAPRRPRAPPQADEVRSLRPRALEPRDRLRRAAAGREHRVHHEHLGRLDAGRDVLVVADGAQRLLVPVHAEMPDARVGHQAQEAVDHPEPARRIATTTTGSASCTPAAGSSGVWTSWSRAQRGASPRRRGSSPPGRASGEPPSACRGRAGSTAGCAAGHGRPRNAVGHRHRPHRIRWTTLAAVSAPRRNVELKTTDPDPERSLEICSGWSRGPRGPRPARHLLPRARRPPGAARRRRRAAPR